MKNSSNKKAFTLVELIVVITILAILWTIAFISLQWYSANARDSVRIANLTNMEKWLALIQAKDWMLPDPAWDTTTVTLSWSAIMTQWEITQTIAEQLLKMSGDITDPINQSNPIYSTNIWKEKFQIALFLEAENLVTSHITNATYAANWQTFITKWNKLWIILNENEVPLNQQINHISTFELNNASENYKAYITSDEVIEWQWSSLTSIVTNTISGTYKSCKDILDKHAHTAWIDGKYTISLNSSDFQVYCDMTTDWGGWTIIVSDWPEVLLTELNNVSTVPSPNSPGLIPYFLSTNISELASQMRVVSVTSPNEDYSTYDLSGDWLNNLILENAEQGYLYSGAKGFTWWKLGAHKCNFSIMVIWTWWCWATLSVLYPADWSALWASGASWNGLNSQYWARIYSWHFLWDWNSYRLGWVSPSGISSTYDSRLASYLMIR